MFNLCENSFRGRGERGEQNLLKKQLRRLVMQEQSAKESVSCPGPLEAFKTQDCSAMLGTYIIFTKKRKKCEFLQSNRSSAQLWQEHSTSGILGFFILLYVFFPGVV